MLTIGVDIVWHLLRCRLPHVQSYTSTYLLRLFRAGDLQHKVTENCDPCAPKITEEYRLMVIAWIHVFSRDHSSGGHIGMCRLPMGY
jgi:hypothetical protein